MDKRNYKVWWYWNWKKKKIHQYKRPISIDKEDVKK